MHRLIETPSHIFVRRVPDHASKKSQILQKIQDMGEFSYRGFGNSITNTDYHLPGSILRGYMDTAQSIFFEHLNDFIGVFGYSSYEVGRIWFQQYGVGDFHDWHTHGDCTFSSVYYVDLPCGTPKTSFMYRGVEFTVDVEEGDILTFPTHFAHKSNKNQSDHKKTVLSFNANAYP